jgi:hypothetical protein
VPLYVVAGAPSSATENVPWLLDVAPKSAMPFPSKLTVNCSPLAPVDLDYHVRIVHGGTRTTTHMNVWFQYSPRRFSALLPWTQPLV